MSYQPTNHMIPVSFKHPLWTMLPSTSKVPHGTHPYTTSSKLLYDSWNLSYFLWISLLVPLTYHIPHILLPFQGWAEMTGLLGYQSSPSKAQWSLHSEMPQSMLPASITIFNFATFLKSNEKSPVKWFKYSTPHWLHRKIHVYYNIYFKVCFLSSLQTTYAFY